MHACGYFEERSDEKNHLSFAINVSQVCKVTLIKYNDGTIALGNVLSRAADITFGGGVTSMPSGNTNLTIEISNDHPISLTYNSALTSSDG